MRLRLAVVFSLCAFGTSFATGVFAEEVAAPIQVEAQALDGALIDLSRQLNVSIVAPADLVSGKSAPAVAGTLTPSAALTQLLQGSGLTFTPNDGGGYTIASRSVNQMRSDSNGTSGNSNSGTRQTVGLEQIVVRSEKRVATQQTVPVPVSAFSGAALEREVAIDLQDFSSAIPNTQLENVGLFKHAAAFSIRGIGTSGIESFDDPHVAVFVDGIYQARNAMSLVSMLDIESVEVLRGPQGTLYGRNAFAGAIAVRSKRPDMDEVGGNLGVDVGNAGRVSVDLVGNLPLVEGKVAVRLASHFHRSSGFYENNGIIDAAGTVDPDIQGRRVAGDNYYLFRPSLRFTPNDRLDITLIGEIFRDRGDGGVASNQLFDPEVPTNAFCGPVGSAPGTGIDCPVSLFEILGFPGTNPFGDSVRGEPGDGSDPHEIGSNLPFSQQRQNRESIILDANYGTGFGSFNLLFNYAKARQAVSSEADGVNVDLFSTFRFDTYETWSTEFTFISEFSDWIDVIAGLFYFRDEYAAGPIQFTPPAGFGGGMEFSLDNPALAYGVNAQQRETWAFYTQFDIHVTDQLTVVLGGRYSWERKFDVTNAPITPIAVSGIPAGSDFSEFPIGPNSRFFGPQSESWDSFAPRVGLDYQMTDDVLLFAFWQRAFKSGGFNNNSGSFEVFTTPVGQERADNFEIGMKSEWFERRLRLNINAFYSKFNSLQQTTQRPDPNTASGTAAFINNAADMKSYGIEVEFSALITEQLTVYGNAGFNKAKFTDFCADLDGPEFTADPASGRAVCGDVTQLVSGLWLAEVDYSDLVPVRAPKWQLRTGFTYDFPAGNMGTFTLGSNISYTSRLFVSTLNSARSDRRPVFMINANINWESPDGNYRISVWGKNLNNDVERLGMIPVATLWALAQATRPREYGVSVYVDF